MFIQRFTSFQYFTDKNLSKISLFNFSSAKPCQGWKLFNVKSTFKYGNAMNLSKPFLYGFSSTKKGSKNPQKQAYKLMKSSLKVDEKGEKYFLLYDAQKQQNSFKIISGLFLLLFGVSFFKIYHTQSGERRDDYIVLLVILGSFVVYQKRILSTLKKVTLNSKGDNISITKFNLLAIGENTIQAPVSLLKGLSRASRFGGYKMKGGDKERGFKEMQFWFSNQYITDRPTFQYVSLGKCPKIVDQFTEL